MNEEGFDQTPLNPSRDELENSQNNGRVNELSQLTVSADHLTSA